MQHFFRNIQGWFTYPRLYQGAVVKQQGDGHFVEVGSWRGRSAAYLAVEIINSGKKIKLDCVDTWKGSDEGHSRMYSDLLKDDGLYNEFIKNIEPVKDLINPIRMPSIEAARLYADNSLDFIFIDAAHDYLSVLSDLNAWHPKLKSNGIFAGHDIGNRGVNRAINDFVKTVARDCVVKDIGEFCWQIEKNTSVV